MVKEHGGRWYVFNHTGEKVLPPKAGFATRAEAVKRLGQIEYFKNEDGHPRAKAATRIMNQFKSGRLVGDSGLPVTSKTEAIAIALDEVSK